MTEAELVDIRRIGPFGIDYTLLDGTEQSFRCSPRMADFIMESWNRRLLQQEEEDIEIEEMFDAGDPIDYDTWN
jgi:hypothetical protein